MAEGSVAITANNKTEFIGLNGGMTVGAALAKFYVVSERDVSGKLSGQTVRLNHNTVEIPGGLSMSLRDRDVITVLTAEVARGGVKGAA